MWPFKKQAVQDAEPRQESAGFFSTDLGPLLKLPSRTKMLARSLQVAMPSGGVAMDSAVSLKAGLSDSSMPDAQLFWYASQGFIGYTACALIAQHWLVDKACSMTGRDAIRQGYEIGGADENVLEALKKADKRHGINATMREFINMGRVFGVRVAIFKVDSTDPEYYEKPFNFDGVTPGSYRGIAQVDPYWVTPELDAGSLSSPDSLHFYQPTFYRIGTQRYHRSHLAIYIPHPVADLLKPSYQYGGVSVPQRIYERVYASERTANEAPQLAMTKRLTGLNVSDAALANPEKLAEKLEEWIAYRDNYGVKVLGDGEVLSQFDTALGDLDTVIMSQYQLVAAIANVPATKLLGTVPKGFNSTGDYELETYRNELESIQSNDLTDFLERHHALVMRSEIAPRLKIEPVQTTIDWRPLDSPTAEQWATINKTKAETDVLLSQVGAIDGLDVRRRVAADKDSDHYGLAEDDLLGDLDDGEEGSVQPETPAVGGEATERPVQGISPAAVSGGV